MNTLRKLIENFNTNIKIRYDEQMSKHTTFKVGGNADVFFDPSSIEEMKTLISFLKKNEQPFFVFGAGSNIVVSDSGINGSVICTKQLKSVKILQENQSNIALKCEAGALMNDIASFCENNGISGLEPFSGLPGTIGGAVFMNARCYEYSISDIIKTVLFYNSKTDSIETYQFNNEDWAYKKSPFQNTNNIILEVVLSCSRGNRAQIKEKNSYYIEDRQKKGHFNFPSAGSVFKNNRDFGSPSGKIIDQAGLRGFCIGGAQVASWHGNFIINKGTATAEDIHNLVLYIIENVKNKTGFTLEPEIIFKGRGFDS
jgi:UDP-N-acetylmuramate dehydrogenase